MKRFLTMVSLFVLSVTACAESASLVGVVDAGSTGSRLHVYMGKPAYKELSSKKISPGLATLDATPEAIDAYLSKLFKDAPQKMSVYFYATAGMRLLPYDKQDKIYALVQDWFAKRHIKLIEAKTISGQEEGVYAWLAANKHLKNQGVDPNKSLAIMDMGGASVQVVFPVAQARNASDYIKVTVDGEQKTLFVHSFLGLGRELVMSQMLEKNVCYSEGYPMPDKSLGQGDAYACSQKVSVLVNDVHEASKVVKPAVYAEETDKDWYVIGGLAYLAAEKPFKTSQNEFTTQQLLTQADSALCHRSWSEVKDNYGTMYGLSRACLSASYYHALLSDGYGLSSQEPVHLVPNGSGMDWTMGVVLKNN